jgi:EmrB/QacA subfamily drug resistance transporter
MSTEPQRPPRSRPGLEPSNVAAASPSPDRLTPEVRRLLSVVIPGILLVSVDLTVVNVALDSLGHAFAVSVSSVQWVVTSYILAVGMTLPASSWLARKLGTRRLYLIAIAAFTVSSGLCAAAPSLGALVVFRVLQGAAGGILIPIGQAMVARAAGPARMGRVIATITSVVVLSPIIGPALGGLVVAKLSWRWIFLANVPIGSAALALGLRRLERAPAESAGPLDWRGLLALATGVPALTYGLVQIGSGNHSLTAPAVVIPLLVGAALIAAFVFHALRTSAPLLDMRLYRNRVFSAAAVANTVMGVAVFGPYVLMPLFFEQVQHASSFRAGMLFASQGFGAALAIILVARPLTDRLGAGRLAIVGTPIMTVATLPWVFFSATTPAWWLVVTLMVRGFGIGLVMVPVIAAALAALDPSRVADASAQLSVLQRIGSALGTAVLAAILASELGAGSAQLGSGGHAAQAVAYQRTFIVVVALNVLTIPPAVALNRLGRRSRPAEEAPAARAGSLASSAAD